MFTKELIMKIWIIIKHSRHRWKIWLCIYILYFLSSSQFEIRVAKVSWSIALPSSILIYATFECIDLSNL